MSSIFTKEQLRVFREKNLAYWSKKETIVVNMSKDKPREVSTGNVKNWKVGDLYTSGQILGWIKKIWRSAPRPPYAHDRGMMEIVTHKVAPQEKEWGRTQHAIICREQPPEFNNDTILNIKKIESILYNYDEDSQKLHEPELEKLEKFFEEYSRYGKKINVNQLKKKWEGKYNEWKKALKSVYGEQGDPADAVDDLFQPPSHTQLEKLYNAMRKLNTQIYNYIPPFKEQNPTQTAISAQERMRRIALLKCNDSDWDNWKWVLGALPIREYIDTTRSASTLTLTTSNVAKYQLHTQVHGVGDGNTEGWWVVGVAAENGGGTGPGMITLSSHKHGKLRTPWYHNYKNGKNGWSVKDVLMPKDQLDLSDTGGPKGEKEAPSKMLNDYSS